VSDIRCPTHFSLSSSWANTTPNGFGQCCVNQAVTLPTIDKLKSHLQKSGLKFGTGQTNTEPEADRGPRAGSPRGVVVATGSGALKGAHVAASTRSLPLPVLYAWTHNGALSATIDKLKCVGHQP